MISRRAPFTLSWILLLAVSGAHALTADQVVLLVNSNEPAAAGVAEHYARLRGVPPENILTVALPVGETLPRAVYENELVPQVRAFIGDPSRNGKIRCLLLIYGMPLRVGQRTPTDEQKAEAERIKPELDALRETIKTSRERIKALGEQAQRTAEEDNELKTLREGLPEQEKREAELGQQYNQAVGAETQAALDSELALFAWPPYETWRWVVNPYHFAFPNERRQGFPPVFMTARLDGPTPEDAMRLVTDAVAAEQNGLHGKVYLDSRGIKQNAERPDGYGYPGYDESIRELAALLKEKTSLEVIHDDQPGLFQAGQCPDCMLYCGWYSLANYVDAFDFVPGAIAYHIASAEAVSLRDPNKAYWCPRLIQDGVAATLGPVAEPYTIGFPKPYEFFVILLSGKATLAETYFATLYFNSWMTTLIGDPLYNPFGKAPLLGLENLRPSPLGAPLLWSAPPAQ